MSTEILSIHRGLRQGARVAPLSRPGERVRPTELVVLGALGATAALAVVLVRLRLGWPGHSILFVVFPMALGFALVPRRLAGTTMGIAALCTLGALGAGGAALPGVGAVTSLLLTGPMLDVALVRGRSGWPLYVAFVLGACASNAAAYLVRAAAKIGIISALTLGRNFAAWWQGALGSYALAGVLAGLVAVAAWFQCRRGANGTGHDSASRATRGW